MDKLYFALALLPCLICGTPQLSRELVERTQLASRLRLTGDFLSAEAVLDEVEAAALEHVDGSTFMSESTPSSSPSLDHVSTPSDVDCFASCKYVGRMIWGWGQPRGIQGQ